MCGIAGISSSIHSTSELRHLISQMTSALSHRGPDSSDIFIADDASVALGFRRLAIRDLDSRANQPMLGSDGRSRIIFNGEIYNSEDLCRKYLHQHRLATTSDTEILLELLIQESLPVLPELDGMFGLAFHNPQDNSLLLARDQSGEKPLYLYHGNGWVAFASELRAFRQFGLTIDPTHAPLYFQYGYLPAPTTFYHHVTQIEPGEWISLRRGELLNRHYFHRWVHQSWSTKVEKCEAPIDALLEKAVHSRMVSDVPVGIFLSGGVDSSLVAAFASQYNSKPLPAFTVAVDDPAFDESPHARRIADYLGLEHHIVPMKPEALFHRLDDFFDCYEQPFADTSGIPSMILCEAASQTVKVALCGDGGDEFFSGYQRYRWFHRALKTHFFPTSTRKMIGGYLQSHGGPRWKRIGNVVVASDPASLYGALVRPWNASPLAELLPNHTNPEDCALEPLRNTFSQSRRDPITDAACFDAHHYIPGDLQVKMDRASMRYSLEVRCPLLHPGLTHYGASRVLQGKTEIGGKRLLREALGRKIPKKLFDRPKKGFSIPLSRWLSGPLKERLYDTLNEPSFRQCDWINHQTVDAAWSQFMAGDRSLAKSLWLIFTLAHWMTFRGAPNPRVSKCNINLGSLV